MQWKHRALIPAILDRHCAPSLLALSNPNDAGARFAGANRLRAAVIRMPEVQPRWDQCHCVGSLQTDSGWLAHRRTRDAGWAL